MTLPCFVCCFTACLTPCLMSSSVYTIWAPISSSIHLFFWSEEKNPGRGQIPAYAVTTLFNSWPVLKCPRCRNFLQGCYRCKVFFCFEMIYKSEQRCVTTNERKRKWKLQTITSWPFFWTKWHAHTHYLNIKQLGSCAVCMRHQDTRLKEWLFCNLSV